MHWEKKICIRITTRRLVGGLLVSSILANLVIVGVVFGATPLSAAPILTPSPGTGTATSVPISATPAGETETPAPPASQSPTAIVPPAESPTSGPTLDMCVLYSHWPRYTVRQGDTLDSLARAIGSSVEELMLANCLRDERIGPGQVLYLPRLPVTPPTPTFWSIPADTATPTATGSATPTGTATATSSITPTNTLTASPTATYTATATMYDRIIFLDPSARYYQCPAGSRNFYVSVIPVSLWGIRSVTAFYSINGKPWGQADLSPDGSVYYGSGQGTDENTAVDGVNYSFVAYDDLGNRTESDIYRATLIPCDPPPTPQTPGLLN